MAAWQRFLNLEAELSRQREALMHQQEELSSTKEQLSKELSSTRDQLGKQREELNHQQERLASYQKAYQMCLHVRATVLESLVQLPSVRIIGVRNQMVHGADLQHDLEVIRQSPENRLNVRCQGFQIIYKLSVTKYEERLQTAPEQIIDTLNRRGDMNLLYYWNENSTSQRREAKEELQTLCDSIVNSWLKSLENSTSFPGPETEETLKILDDKWRRAYKL